MKKILFFFSAIILLLASCDDTTDTIGGSLTDISDNIDPEAAEFYVTTKSVNGADADFGSINARSSFAYLGKIFDKETSSYITADLMTQVLPLTNQYFSSYTRPTRLFAGIDSIVVYDADKKLLPTICQSYRDELAKEGMTEEQIDEKIAQVRAEKMKYLKADSCYLTFYVSDFKGDSLAQMSVNVKELSQPYVESEDYSIAFNPEENGMVRSGSGSINAVRTYSIKNMVAEGVNKSRSRSHYVSIPLNKEYEGRDDVLYSNYGTYLMKQYLDETAQFHKGYNSQVLFLKNVCPGFYLKHIGGEGAMAKITATTITTYYRMTQPASQDPTAETTVQAVFSGTEESIQHSTITDQSVDKLVSKSNESSSDFTYVKSPNAIYTELTLDVNAIMKDHETDSLSTVRIFFPCRNNDSDAGEYAFSKPANLLILPVDSVAPFFAKKKVYDSRTSFLATYSSATNGYTFGNISSAVVGMYRAWKKSGKTLEEYSTDEETKNWNKFVIIPVEITTTALSSSTSTVTKVSHSMALESTQLRKGMKQTEDDGVSTDNAIIASVIYSRYRK